MSLCALPALALAACVSSPQHPAASETPLPSSHPPSASASASGLQLSGALSVSGQFVVAAAFTSPALVDVGSAQTPAPSGTSCTAYAQGFPEDSQHGGGVGFDPPAARAAGADSSAYVSVSLPTGYRGPGTYSSATLSALSGVATVAVQTGEGSAYYTFNSRGGAITLTVAPNGSGGVSFSSWLDSETRGGNGTGAITGTFNWKCH